MGRKKQHYKIENLVEQIKCILYDNDIEVVNEKPIDYGLQLITDIGSVLNVYVTGKIYICGDFDASEKTKKHLLDLDVYDYLEY